MQRRPRAPRLLVTLAVLLLVVSTATGAGAANDPALDWWTIETPHFRVHYEKNLEPVAERVALLSEDIHRRLIGPMGRVPRKRTEVLITDVTDNSNGSATSNPTNIVRLFVTSPGDLSSLGDYDDWMLGLQTHEYTHILHTDNSSGVPGIINAVLGTTLVPNQLQPRWILEGLAVVYESEFSSGGRIRSSLFDAFLRADYLDDNFATLAQMSSQPRRYPGGTMYYLYGGRFMRWIADVLRTGRVRRSGHRLRRADRAVRDQSRHQATDRADLCRALRGVPRPPQAPLQEADARREAPRTSRRQAHHVARTDVAIPTIRAETGP